MITAAIRCAPEAIHPVHVVDEHQVNRCSGPIAATEFFYGKHAETTAGPGNTAQVLPSVQIGIIGSRSLAGYLAGSWPPDKARRSKVS